MEKVGIIGSGNMAQEYGKILLSLGKQVTVVGRSAESVANFQSQFKNVVCYHGGLENNQHVLSTISHWIIATPVIHLSEHLIILLKNEVPNILIEKPGPSCYDDWLTINEVKGKSKISIAYNRRFYPHVQWLRAEFEDDPLLSFHFEFTEWSHKILPLNKDHRELNRWLVANSSHVIDLAFYLGGKPTELHSMVSQPLGWHPFGVFSGCGKTEKELPFSYHANWLSAGRWSLLLMTRKFQYVLRPLEELKRIPLGSIHEEKVEEANIQSHFKLGLLPMVDAWLLGDLSNFPNFSEYGHQLHLYDKIGNG